MAKRSRQPQKLTFPSWLPAVLLVAAVILTYSPLWDAGYVWDDDVHLTGNRCIVGPLGLWQIWTTPAASICPFVLTTFWVEHALWGLHPLPYHLVNVLLHASCAIVLWRVLLALRIPGAWLGAALWALHPLQVESVAWISEMKNTESGLFFLLAVLFYTRAVAANKPATGRNHLLVLLFAALAMMSKFSCAVLPLSLALCAWWMEGSFRLRRLLALWPIFLMAAIASGVTLWLGKFQPPLPGAAEPLDLPQRLAVAGDIVWFYAVKLIWPWPLLPIYSRWQINPAIWTMWLPTLTAATVTALLWVWRTTWARPFFFAWTWFLIGLLPFLGLIDQAFWRYSFVEDHLQYLAAMGPCALAAAGLTVLLRLPALRAGVAACVLAIFAIASWQHSFVYHDNKTLWTNAVAKSPTWVGYAILGDYELMQRDAVGALEYYDRANGVAPNIPDIQDDRGNALSELGRGDEAIRAYQEAIRLRPDDGLFHLSLGLAQGRKGDDEGAFKSYQRAEQLDPTLPRVHAYLGNMLFKKERYAEAAAEYEKAVAADPADYPATNRLAVTLLHLGRQGEAAEYFRKVIRTNPNHPDAHYNLGNILLQAGQTDAAIAEYEQALRIDPRAANAQKNLGLALANSGRHAEALSHFQQVVSLDPSDPVGHNDLGSEFLLSGDAADAIAQYKEALRLKPDYAEAASNLKRAQSAATGR